MKIESQPLEDHQMKLTVEVEPETFEEAKKRAARQFAKRTKIPGFRPGKAPYPVIVRQIGEEAIVEEALELLVKDIYPKALDESGIQPYGPGSLENVASMDPPVLEFVVPLEAEVILGDYRSIRKPYEPKAVTDEDVERVIEDLRSRQAVLEPVERPAQPGDMVYLRLSGERKQVEEGEDPVLILERSMPVVIKTGTEGEAEGPEWPYPGFSRLLIGLSPGDEQTVSHTFAEDSDFESLRGVEAEFHFVVESIKSRTLPEVNDEFAASLGEYDSLDKLLAEIRSDLERQSNEAYNESYDEEVIKEAVESSTIKYPPQMLEREVESIVNNLKNRLEQQNMDIDLYLKTREMDMEGLRAEALPVAETRLKNSLILMKLAEEEKIQVEQDELQNEAMRTMNTLAQSLSQKEARKLADRNVFSNLVGSIMADMLTKRSIERLRDIASGKIDEQSEEPEESAESAEAVQQTASKEGETEPQVAQPASLVEESEEASPAATESEQSTGDDLQREQESSSETS